MNTSMKRRQESIEVTRDLLLRYDKPGPRYTSYPTAPEWRDDFGDAEYRRALADAAARPDVPLSVYVHIPFCHQRCAFCGCNVIVAKKEGVADKYLRYLDREFAMAAEALGARVRVAQLHWGGGTPTYLSIAQLRALYDSIVRHFTIDPGAEIALEIDPRVTTLDQIRALRELGFNRISMGVQDLDPQVQVAITRNQTEEETRRVVDWCRDAGFEGINIDLIYGLPQQRPEPWTETVEKIIDIRPDRLAVYSYAYLPNKLRNQRRIDESALPRGPEKYELFSVARRLFTEAGYRAIGMDHFALPDDELAVAMDERRLYRNFMGYTVVAATAMLGFGTSAIGEVGNAYAQNEKKLSRYYNALDAGRFATACGCFLTEDDLVRGWVIRQLMCNLFLDFQELMQRFGIKYDDYFAAEEQQLREFYDEGFLTREGNTLRLLPLGQVFVRNIAMVFDAYFKRPESHREFSRTV